MGRFNVNFLDLPTDTNPVEETYRPYFLYYDPAHWIRGSGGGSFVHRNDYGVRSSLVVCQHPQHGISLLYSSESEEWVSLASPEKIKEFVAVPDGVVLPLGSFMPAHCTWPAIQMFIAAPQELPTAIQWIASRQLTWPR